MQQFISPSKFNYWERADLQHGRFIKPKIPQGIHEVRRKQDNEKLFV